MVYCRGCGKEIHETAPTCPHCGFVQPTEIAVQEKNSVTNSIWMSVTAFVSAVLMFVNWFAISSWNKDTKLGLLVFAIASLAFGITSIHQKRKGKVLSGISITIAVITILILLGNIA